MCGIVGYVATKKCTSEIALEKWCQQALFVNTLRGKDSTGIAVGFDHLLEEGYLPDIVKDACTAEQFLSQGKVREYFNKWTGKSFVIGHNRAATVGQVTEKNAHPFQHGNISLVHNGTLDYTRNLKGTSTVDSELICETMAVDDHKETLEKLDGAYALVWHDASDGTVNLARNTERPMHFAFSKSGSYMLFASEEWMISGLLSRQGCTLSVDKVMKLASGKWMKLHLDLEDLRKYEVIEFKPAPVYSGYWYGGRYISNSNFGKKLSGSSGTHSGGYIHGGKHTTNIFKKLGIEDGDIIAINLTKETPSMVTENRSNYEGDCLNTNIIELAKAKVEVLSYVQRSGLISINDIFIGTVKSAYENSKNGYTIVSDTLVPVSFFCKDKQIDEGDLLSYLYGFGHNPMEEKQPDSLGMEFTGLEEIEDIIAGLDDLVEYEDEEEDDLGLFDGPNGKPMTKTQFNNATGGVCINCGGNIAPSDHKKIEWVNNGQSALCSDCVSLKDDFAAGFGFVPN